MSNNINKVDEYYEIVQAIETSSTQAHKAKENVRREHVKSQLYRKDVILPAPAAEDSEIVKKSKAMLEKPQLPPAGANAVENENDSGPLPLNDPDNHSIIAIIGEVLTLQAKTNSNFWSIVWQQANESMAISVSLAPVIQNAVESNWNAQADMTSEESEMAKTDGWITLIAAGTCVLSGVYAAGSEGIGAGEDAENFGAKQTTEDAIEKDPATSGRKLNSELNTMKEGEAPSSKLTRAWKSVKGFGGKTIKAFFKSLDAAGKTAMMSDMMTKATTSLFVDAPAKANIAQDQTEAGKWDATSKVAEQYSQYYSQSFSQGDSLRQKTEQNIDYAMSILKSASDTITQTTVSMFRG